MEKIKWTEAYVDYIKKYFAPGVFIQTKSEVRYSYTKLFFLGWTMSDSPAKPIWPISSVVLESAVHTIPIKWTTADPKV